MVPLGPLAAWQKSLGIFALVSLPVPLPYTSWESYLGQGQYNREKSRNVWFGVIRIVLRINYRGKKSLWVNIFQKQIVTIQRFQTHGRPFIPRHMLHRSFGLCWDETAWQKTKRNITTDDKTISGKNTDLGSPIMVLLVSSDLTNIYKIPTNGQTPL